MSARYTAVATTVGGRSGHVTSADNLLNFDLSVPKDIGGPGKPGTTNPEQLFAAGYSACFGSAIDFVAKQRKLNPSEIRVTAEVSIDAGASGFDLSVRLRAHVAGVDQPTAQSLVQAAHEICPYSKATRNNIAIELVAE